MRDLIKIFASSQTTVVSFVGASVSQLIKMMECKDENHLDRLIIMLGTNDISRIPVTPDTRWELLLIWLLNKLKEKYFFMSRI